MQDDKLPLPSVLLLHMLSIVCNVFYRLYFRLACHRDRAMLAALKAEQRPIIVVFNHSSHLDVPAVGVCLGVGLVRRMIMPGKKELFENRALAWFLCQTGVIPVDRDINDMHVVRKLMRALQQGRMIIMAPEGTRSADGRLQAFKTGFVKLAHRSNAVVVPVGIRGAYDAFPRGAKFPRPLKLSVHVGTPVDLSAQLPARPTADVYAEAAVEIWEQMLGLCST
ncbi:MAG: 1-acyl-sn-glycerol-3-phosphate acyltransferase [Anaerolineae bacterium]|nr:1-acyl-sn-glycerol-3-phosphate acyltransferase [Anaerolineae bacterium]